MEIHDNEQVNAREKELHSEIFFAIGTDVGKSRLKAKIGEHT